MKNTILRIILSVIAGIFSCVNITVAQATEKIHRIEYFFDTDPGFGNATTVNVIPAATTITNPYIDKFHYLEDEYTETIKKINEDQYD